MRRQTKACWLTVRLLNDVVVRGRFHIDATTSSTIRPSDALRNLADSFLVLTDAEYVTGDQVHNSSTLLVRSSSVAFLELPPDDWDEKTGRP